MSQWAYLTALTITLVTEAPVVLIAYRPTSRVVIGFVAVNAFTHGVLWMIAPRTLTLLWILEVAIAIVEGALYKMLFGGSVRRALVVSFLANAISLLVGLAHARLT